MFKKLLNQGQAGDNVGLLLRGLKREDVVRGQLVAKPGSVKTHKVGGAEGPGAWGWGAFRLRRVMQVLAKEHHCQGGRVPPCSFPQTHTHATSSARPHIHAAPCSLHAHPTRASRALLSDV
jgi:hypothetical protein